MKLKDLLKLIPAPDKTTWGANANYDDFQTEFNYWEDANWSDFDVYYTEFGSWLCTDTEVGWEAYFYEDELIAISFQSARKSPKEFQWVSQEKADAILQHMKNISIKEEETQVEILTETKLEKEMEAGYTVTYSSQLMTNTLIEIETGLPCRVIEKYDQELYNKERDMEKYTHDIVFYGVKVRTKDGEEKLLDLRTDLLVPWKLKEK